MYLIFLLYALFASVFTIAKQGLEYTEPIFFVGFRMTIAGVLILLYLFFFQKEKLIFNKKKHLWLLFWLAFFNIYLTNVFEFLGLKYLTSFKTCFIYSLSPFVSAFFSYLVFSEKMTFKKWLGFAIGFAGFLPILLNESTPEESMKHVLIFSWPEISVIIAAFSSVFGWILLRHIVKDNGYSPLFANGTSMVIGGIFALVHSYFAENWDPIPVTETIPFLKCTLLLIIISSIICYNLYGYLLKRFTATLMSFAGFTTPLFAAFFGWLYLDEKIDSSFYLSAIIVFIGLVLFFQEELKQGYYKTSD